MLVCVCICCVYVGEVGMGVGEKGREKGREKKRGNYHQNRRNTLQSHPSIDMTGGQRDESRGALPLVLHKHQIPDLFGEKLLLKPTFFPFSPPPPSLSPTSKTVGSSMLTKSLAFLPPILS